MKMRHLHIPRSVLCVFCLALMLPAVAMAQKPAPSKGPDRLMERKVNDARGVLLTARKHADLAGQVTMEKQKINNYTIAADKLRIFTQKLEKIEEMTGPGHPVLNDLIQDYESTRAYVHKACAGIREKLLAGEKAPEDIYKGRDKGRFKDMIIAEWKKAYPKDEILSVRFHSADFQRTRNKRWNDAVNQWQYTDVSALAVSVIVRTDDVTATIFPAFINKDNQDGRISAGVHTKYGGYVVREILAKNI